MTLGDALGRLADPPTRDRFESFRLAMVDQLFAAEVGASVPHAAWSRAFETMVAGIEQQIIADAERAIGEAAAFSRYPARRLQAMLPTSVRADALRNRLLASGMPLERLEGLADDAMTRRERGVALETAWEGVLRVAQQEIDHWNALSARVMAWRRSTAPLWYATGILLVVTAVIAGWLGGQLSAPEWFAPVAKWWWGLPVW